MGQMGLRRCGPRAAAVALTLFASTMASVGAGCAVSETDVQRWETTEAGPEKLYAIVTHDKYPWALREDAVLSLVRMHPRNGKRIGLEYLVLGYDTPLGRVQGALSVVGEQARRRILDDLTPKLVLAMEAGPTGKALGAAGPEDESIPYKDAAFALLSHEPPLATDDATKSALAAALTRWVQVNFEERVDNRAQQFGVEQIMRFLGAPSVKSLPHIITLDSTKVDKACELIADIGDDETKMRASDGLVALAKHIDSTTWVDKQRALVNEANAKAKVTVSAAQVSDQLKAYQEQELEKVFTDMKRVGGRPTVEYCLAFAKDKSKSEKMRTDALAALENRVDKNNASDVSTIFDIVKDDSSSDRMRGVAMARMGELPKDMVVAKLYTVFDRKWQVRIDAAQLILKTMTTKDVPEFMRHLPADARTKMALSEPITYGALILRMDSAGGARARDVLSSFLSSSNLGAKMTAIGSYYMAKKAEAAPVRALEDDKTALPKCQPSDNCGWTCDVPTTPGGQERETKPVATVGDFVKWCVEPSLQ